MRPGGLTPLQVQATRLFFSLPESVGFAVAGGALIARGLIHRPTRDVDLFLIDADAPGIALAVRAFETAIGSRGWSHRRVIDQGDFVRLAITSDQESLIIDLGRDSPARNPPMPPTWARPSAHAIWRHARRWPRSAAPKPGTLRTSSSWPAATAAAASSAGPPRTTPDSTRRSSPTCSPASAG
jgi:hypothetical protein